MSTHAFAAAPGNTACDYQEVILPRVSRTFALTIPLLPDALRTVVTNAYLLCRIVDTIEDESALSVDQKQYFHKLFVGVVSGTADASVFAAELAPLLRTDASDGERDLVRHAGTVVEVTRGFNANQRAALTHCLTVMSEGMPCYERCSSRDGLPDQSAMDHYCYCVAGVVGETLTTLFCDHSDAIARQRDAMMPLGISFGHGLQMVNILKDFWEDHQRGVCWLPRSVFLDSGVELRDLRGGVCPQGFAEGYKAMIALAHGHLHNGFEYTLLIPEQEAGIRRFCLLALGLAARTLQLIQHHPDFTCGNEVKVSHRAVADTLIMTRVFARHDWVLRRWFDRIAKGLPLQHVVVEFGAWQKPEDPSAEPGAWLTSRTARS